MKIMYNFHWNNINEEMIDDMVDNQHDFMEEVAEDMANPEEFDKKYPIVEED